MARKVVLADDVSIDYRKVYEIVGEVTARFGTDIILNQARSTGVFSY